MQPHGLLHSRPSCPSLSPYLFLYIYTHKLLLYLCEKVSHSVVSDSVTSGTAVLQLLCPWGFPGKSTGVGCHVLLQGIFPTQGLNPDLLHCRQILYCLSHIYIYTNGIYLGTTIFQEAVSFTFCLEGKWTLQTSSPHCSLSDPKGDKLFYVSPSKTHFVRKSIILDSAAISVFF